MFRLATSMFALAAAAFSSPVLAADWSDNPADIYREGYSIEPYEWSEMGDQTDGLHFETGLRYWYSMGSRNFDLSGTTFEGTDTSHTVEVHLRVEDDATATYAKGWAGYSVAINGDYSDPFSSGEVTDGQIGYGGADFGWNAIDDGKGNGLAGFVGYNYWNDSPRTSRALYTTATSAEDISYNEDTGLWSLPGDTAEDRIELHMLRLGLSGKAEINDFFDISGEVAAVPFATVSGVLGGDEGPTGTDDLGPFLPCGLGDLCPPQFFKASATEIEGWGYGGMAEVMAGFHPTENITFRLGGRAWYVQGTYDANYTGAMVTPPQEQPPEGDPPEPADPLYGAPDLELDDYTETENPFSMLRYGLLAELTYRF